MAKYSTPGVYLKEIDKSEVLLSASTGGAATVIKSSQGPMWRPITLNNTRQLKGIFGSPTLPEENENGDPVVPNYGYGLYAASNYLAEAQGLTVVRGADGPHVITNDVDTGKLRDYTYATQTYGFHTTTGLFTSEYPDPTNPDANIIHEIAAQLRPNSISSILAIEDTASGNWVTDNITKPNFGFAFSGGPGGQGYNVGTSVEFFYAGCPWQYKFDDEDKIDTLMSMFDSLGSGNMTEQEIADYITENELVAPLVFQVKVYTKNASSLWGKFTKTDLSAPVEVFECNATSRSLRTEQGSSLFITDVINGNSGYIYAKYLKKIEAINVVNQITNRVSYTAINYDILSASTVPTQIRFNGVTEFDKETSITKYGYKYDVTNTNPTPGWVYDPVDPTKLYDFELPVQKDETEVPDGSLRDAKVDFTATDPDQPLTPIGVNDRGWFPAIYQGVTVGDATTASYEFGYKPSDLVKFTDNKDTLIQFNVSPAVVQIIDSKPVTAPLVEFNYPEVILWDTNNTYVAADYGPEIKLVEDATTVLTPLDPLTNDGGTLVGILNTDTAAIAQIPTNEDYFGTTQPVYDPSSVMYWLEKVKAGKPYSITYTDVDTTPVKTVNLYTIDDEQRAKTIIDFIKAADKARKDTETDYNRVIAEITVDAASQVKIFKIDPDNSSSVIEGIATKQTKEVTDLSGITSYVNTFDPLTDKVVEIDQNADGLGGTIDLPSYYSVLRLVDATTESGELFIGNHLNGGSEPDVDYDHIDDEGVEAAWMLLSDSEKIIAPHLRVPTWKNELKQFVNKTITPKRKRDCLQISQSGSITVAMGGTNYDLRGDLHAEKIIAAELYGYPNSSYIGLYCGWSLVVDASNDREVWLPNAIFASQAIARTDNVANVWDAPAGQTRGVIPALRQKFDLNDDEIGKLYDNNINACKEFLGIGAVIWGQKTAQRKASALDRINVRRTLLFIEKTVQLFLNPLVLDVNNTPEVRLRVWNQINNFLQSIKAQGGLTDYQVICDDSNNTADVIDANTLNVDILVKPVKTIEFIDVNVIVASTGLSFEEARVR